MIVLLDFSDDLLLFCILSTDVPIIEATANAGINIIDVIPRRQLKVNPIASENSIDEMN